MDPQRLRQLLASFKSGELAEDDLLKALRDLPFENLGFARVDHHRALRCGHAEVIFCQGKTPEQVAAIADAILAAGHNVLATRADAAHMNAVSARHADALYHAQARIISINRHSVEKIPGTVALLTAGTSDIPVAEEARVTAEMTGSQVEAIFDVGVAGLHRLLEHRPLIDRARLIIVVAGMEGALASVVAGLASVPIIAVPTSVGYGAGFKGLAPLLTMMNSCAAGVVVVNIDNGFGAGYAASLMGRANRRPQQDT